MTEPIIWHRTHCSRMDHGGCALWAGVTDNRIVRIKGDPDGYLNRGFVCTKGLASADRLNHPDRLRRPLRRVGRRGEGRFEPISWDAALRMIAERLSAIRDREGARAVAFCQGMPKGLEHFVLIRLANLFGSPNVVAVQDVCHAPREVSGMHTCGFYPVVDFHHPSQRVILWGSNPMATHEEGLVGKLLLDGVRAGTELAVVDPRRTALADRAAFHLPVRPGADAVLALAFLEVIIGEGRYDADFVKTWTSGFEDLAEHVKEFSPEATASVTGVDPETVRAAARWYAAARPGVIAWGNPIEQTPRAFDAARALISLMAVCGNLDVPGGNIAANEPKILGLGEFVRADRIPDKRREMIHAHHGAIPRLMTVPPALFKEAVLTGHPYPVRGAYIQCSNPVLTWADTDSTRRALSALDFLAVSDVFMTPTAALADVVLPAATGYEFDDIGHYGLGHGVLLARPKVVDPPADCRPDREILWALGRMITDPADWPAAPEHLLDAVVAPAGLTYAGFVERGHLTGPERFRKYLEKGFRTPTGKVELTLSRADRFGLPALPRGEVPPIDPDYPLLLTAAKDPHYLHSSYRWVDRLREKSPRPTARIHSETAAAWGVQDGGMMTIETRWGRIRQTARVTDRIRPGVVLAAYGWWFPEDGVNAAMDPDRANYNRLTSARDRGREFGTPRLKGLACRIGPGMAQ